mmetsp:Transcript_33793/g.60368  ORF Transcript_33793/g.60368 Transcript_33793/m.60368 type:complete len:372 (-) Transcript_33793:59-1174(-)
MTPWPQNPPKPPALVGWVTLKEDSIQGLLPPLSFFREKRGRRRGGVPGAMKRPAWKRRLWVAKEGCLLAACYCSGCCLSILKLFLGSGEVAAARARHFAQQCGPLAQLPRDPLVVLHRPRGLRLVTVLGPLLGHLPLLQRLQDADCVASGEILVVVVAEAFHTLGVVRNADHGRVHARTHALHFAQREHPILCGLTYLDAQVISDRLFDLLGTVQAAGRGAAHHDVVLTNLGAVKHCVEGGNLVHTDGRHLKYFRHLIHCGQSEPPLVLLLCEVQHRDTGRCLVVAGVPAQDFSHPLIVSLREVEWRLQVVLRRVLVDVENIGGVCGEGAGGGRGRHQQQRACGSSGRGHHGAGPREAAHCCAEHLTVKGE